MVRSNIIARLPLRDAVCSRGISKRWYSLWASTPLFLDDADLFDSRHAQRVRAITRILLKHPGPFYSIKLTGTCFDLVKKALPLCGLHRLWIGFFRFPAVSELSDTMGGFPCLQQFGLLHTPIETADLKHILNDCSIPGSPLKIQIANAPMLRVLGYLEPAVQQLQIGDTIIQSTQTDDQTDEPIGKVNMKFWLDCHIECVAKSHKKQSTIFILSMLSDQIREFWIVFISAPWARASCCCFGSCFTVTASTQCQSDQVIDQSSIDVSAAQNGMAMRETFGRARGNVLRRRVVSEAEAEEDDGAVLHAVAREEPAGEEEPLHFGWDALLAATCATVVVGSVGLGRARQPRVVGVWQERGGSRRHILPPDRRAPQCTVSAQAGMKPNRSRGRHAIEASISQASAAAHLRARLAGGVVVQRSLSRPRLCACHRVRLAVAVTGRIRNHR
ncbi:hypothetical protein PR202_ga13990 [Eleusine coracana subsp. coracana]|uniref:F-box/LRR-repeat protein 15/At3g58940/PEG3-like LRR domain-containing protein n=1 Tax=Eleusine coracana subsp. coracana TaxID=191504 RepID=A0AAV5CGF3_ELECO|nr:hypothetical protein PR202_ga13990 [Eleusine coracana subsp. coracana]